MQNFIITEEQANKILTVLAEVPAKLSFDAICVLRQIVPMTESVALMPDEDTKKQKDKDIKK